MFMLGGVRRGDGGEGLQLEVSEWTLPGPSVGDVTDEGVGASCQPPFVCGDERGDGQSGAEKRLRLHVWRRSQAWRRSHAERSRRAPETGSE